MKNSIKLRKASAFTAGAFVATFLILSVLLLGLVYGITEWWKHPLGESLYSSTFNFGAVALALFATFYLSWNRTPVLLGKCNEAGLQWSQFAPNSMFVILALVRGQRNEHMVIIQNLNGSGLLSDGIAVTTTTRQMDYFEYTLSISSGDCVFLAGTIREIYGTTHVTHPVGYDSGCWKVGGATLIDLDKEPFNNPSVADEEVGHVQAI